MDWARRLMLALGKLAQDGALVFAQWFTHRGGQPYPPWPPAITGQRTAEQAVVGRAR